MTWVELPGTPSLAEHVEQEVVTHIASVGSGSSGRLVSEALTECGSPANKDRAVLRSGLC